MREWKLITDLPVRSRAEAIEKLDWYAMRWKIEVPHKILKQHARQRKTPGRVVSQTRALGRTTFPPRD